MRIVLTTEFICGQAGCATIGMAFVVAILLLVAIGWLYEMWRQWAIRYLEKLEQDIRRERYLKAIDQNEGSHNSKDEEAA
jgi:hypothetical protein